MKDDIGFQIDQIVFVTLDYRSNSFCNYDIFGPTKIPTASCVPTISYSPSRTLSDMTKAIIVVFSIVAILLIILVIYCCYKIKKNKAEMPLTTQSNQFNEPLIDGTKQPVQNYIVDNA